MTEAPSEPSFIAKLVAEPLSYFAIIALGLFLFYAVSQQGQANRLEIDQREIDARLFLQEIAQGFPLTPQQRQQAVEEFIDEQVLVQEALALGLDKDTRIHTILAQKTRHVLSGDIIQPSETELAEFYEQYASNYQSLPTVSVNELVFNNNQDLPREVIQGLKQGLPGEELLLLAAGSDTPLPRVSHTDLANIFSEEFADSVFAAQNDEWVGPFRSNRGQHWLQIYERTASLRPELNDIADLVRLDWIALEEDKRLAQEVNKLRAKYSVVITNETQ